MTVTGDLRAQAPCSHSGCSFHSCQGSALVTGHADPTGCAVALQGSGHVPALCPPWGLATPAGALVAVSAPLQTPMSSTFLLTCLLISEDLPLKPQGQTQGLCIPPLEYSHLVKLKVTQSCSTLCQPVDYIVPGILQASVDKPGLLLGTFLLFGTWTIWLPARVRNENAGPCVTFEFQVNDK